MDRNQTYHLIPDVIKFMLVCMIAHHAIDIDIARLPMVTGFLPWLMNGTKGDMPILIVKW